MEDPRLLRIILFGLVLAALTIGYLIFSGRFLKTNQIVTQNKTVLQASIEPSPRILDTTFSSPSPSVDPKKTTIKNTPDVTPTPSAYETITKRTDQRITTLPKTGMPTVLIGTGFLSAIISGWFLRKYPE